MDGLYSGNDSWHIAALENNSYCCVLISRLSLINCAENCKLLYLIINKNKQDDEILGIHRKAQDENHIKNDAQFTDTPPGASVSALTNWRMALDRLAAGISRSKWKGLVTGQESWQGTVSRRNICRETARRVLRSTPSTGEAWALPRDVRLWAAPANFMRMGLAEGSGRPLKNQDPISALTVDFREAPSGLPPVSEAQSTFCTMHINKKTRQLAASYRCCYGERAQKQFSKKKPNSPYIGQKIPNACPLLNLNSNRQIRHNIHLDQLFGVSQGDYTR
jgi:hypothetical protein